jgi:S-adenosylmethionine:tRNA ribosyltransferase-isomerase
MRFPLRDLSPRCTILAVRTADFDYALAAEQIAQRARPRGTSRLLVLDRRTGLTLERRIGCLAALLRPGDLLLLNEVRVIAARLRAHRAGGGDVELLLVRPLGGATWEVMARPGKRLRAGVPLALADGRGLPQRRLEGGNWLVSFDPPLDEARIEEQGEVPLPPYIRRPAGPEAADRMRYQTVYARGGRAVAAPTAGLHFSHELLEAIERRQVEAARLTLHVGPGTFRPVKVEDPREHVLEAEDYEIPAATAAAINRAIAGSRRIVCVGTTACRALEHALIAGRGRVREGSARADLFILPGFAFRGTGALLTNFHLPRSTLLMLVAAFAGREPVLAAYARAAASGFRFYSYGDAMLVV